MTKKQKEQQGKQDQGSPMVLQYISDSEKKIKEIHDFLRKHLELYGNTLVRMKHLDNLASELSIKQNVKFRRDLERLRLIERYKKVDDKWVLISIYDREWLKTKPDHVFKISEVGKLIAKSASMEEVRKYIVVSFLLKNEIMSKITKKMVGVIAVPIEQAIKEALAESINEAKDEKIKTKFVQLLNDIQRIIETIEELSKICPDIIKLERSASGTLVMKVNPLTVRSILEKNMLAYPEIDVKRYAECLTSAVAEFWKGYAEYILSGEWQAIPDTPLEQIYKKINELLGVELDINRHVELCKKLANLGYITYSYGGISIVKGKQAERHWINLKPSLYQRLKERLQKITQDF